MDSAEELCRSEVGLETMFLCPSTYLAFLLKLGLINHHHSSHFGSTAGRRSYHEDTIIACLVSDGAG